MQICFFIQNFLFLHDLFSLSLFLALALSRFITGASLISFRWKACSALQNMQKYLYVGQCQPTTYSFWGQVDEALFVISLICNIFFTTYIIHTQKACPQIVIEYIGTKRIQPSINIPSIPSTNINFEASLHSTYLVRFQTIKLFPLKLHHIYFHHKIQLFKNQPFHSSNKKQPHYTRGVPA